MKRFPRTLLVTSKLQDIFTPADCSARPFGRSEKANLVGVSAVQRWDVGQEGVTARVEVKLDVVTCSQSGEAVTFMQIRVQG